MSGRLFASRLATSMASVATKAGRSAARVELSSVTSKRTMMTGLSRSPLQTLKRQQAPSVFHTAARQGFARTSKRAYSSEIANAMVEVSQNIGMGSAAIGLSGAGVGIGLVFASLITGVARNPALRGQLFTYAILGFAFVEAIGLFDLMVALMAKFT